MAADILSLVNDISTHALTEGDFSGPEGSGQPHPISTHALTEGDNIPESVRCNQIISTHALTEGDGMHYTPAAYHSSFQLTPSRRATPMFHGVAA